MKRLSNHKFTKKQLGYWKKIWRIKDGKYLERINQELKMNRIQSCTNNKNEIITIFKKDLL